MAIKADEYLEAYGEFAKALRTWLVAYGIGAPVLLVTNETVSKALKTSGHAKSIAIFFLMGVALRVLLAAFNKAAMWGLYYGEENAPFKNSSYYKLAYWFSEHLSIDLLVDAATLVVFAIATWKSVGAVIL